VPDVPLEPLLPSVPLLPELPEVADVPLLPDVPLVPLVPAQTPLYVRVPVSKVTVPTIAQNVTLPIPFDVL
jgi:hypothetical protein